MENSQYLKHLLLKYTRNQISEEEKLLLFTSLAQDNQDEQWKALLNDIIQENHFSIHDHSSKDPDWEPVLQSIINHRDQVSIDPVRRTYFNYRWMAAAALFLVLTGVVLMYYFQPEQEKFATNTLPSDAVIDIPPGKDGAILTLSDGKTVLLDSLNNGLVAREVNASVHVTEGRLAYTPSATNVQEVAYNKISTPRGRQYRLQLPDGTGVWLNAASSIRFPTAFTGMKREVTITGEVYFEVAKVANMPFHVHYGKSSQIEVLGTHFNVNAYTDEATLNTTLLEGLVRLYPGNGPAVTLQPGQQAQVDPDKGSMTKVLNAVNTENIISWKNGAFSFDDASLKEVLRQLSRWYDMEVEFRGNFPGKVIRGKMGRDLSLMQMIEVLKGLRVNLRIEEPRKLVVLPEEVQK